MSSAYVSQFVPTHNDLIMILSFPALSKVDSLEVIVTVVNLNDNSPVFKQPNFTVNVPEVRILLKPLCIKGRF